MKIVTPRSGPISSRSGLRDDAGFEGFAGFVLALPRSEPMKYAITRISLLSFARSLNKPRKPSKPRSDEAVKMKAKQ
jgi:hypothetical protein